MGEAVIYPQGRVGVGDTSDEDEGAVTLKKTHAEHELPVCQKPKLPGTQKTIHVSFTSGSSGTLASIPDLKITDFQLVLSPKFRV